MSPTAPLARVPCISSRRAPAMSQMPILFYVSLWHTVSNASTGAALRYSSLAAVTAVQVLRLDLS